MVILDQSGSMRETDIPRARNRSDAAFRALLHNLVGHRLHTGEASSTDMFSLISMSTHADVLLDTEPWDTVLYNRIVDLAITTRPRYHGHYIPALTKACELLTLNAHGRCALMLIFVSDGKPSDPMPYDFRHITHAQYHAEMATKEMGELASQFGRRLTVGTVGIGPQRETFEVLQELQKTAAKYGCIAHFEVSERRGTGVPFTCLHATAHAHTRVALVSPLIVGVMCFCDVRAHPHDRMHPTPSTSWGNSLVASRPRSPLRCSR